MTHDPHDPRDLIVVYTCENEDGAPELLGTFAGTDPEGLTVRYFYGPDEEEATAPADCVQTIRIPYVEPVRPVDRSNQGSRRA